MTAILVIFFVTLTSGIFANELGLIEGNNRFTTDLYRELSKKTDVDFLVSPFSAESVLAFVQSGARGPTAKQLRTSLYLPQDQNEIESGFRSIHQHLRHQPGYVFTTANKLYVKEDFSVKGKFIKTANSVFDADLDTVDFSKSVEAANKMNQWVEDKTESKIRNLISPDKLNAQTRAILINALYFKGNWTTPFIRKFTQDRDFFTLNRQIKRVRTMVMNEDTKTFYYAENIKIGAQYLELPFEGNDAAMGFILPFNKQGIRHLERNIDLVFEPQTFTREYVNMSIPKFRLETQIDVKEILVKLGVTKAFTPGEADFSGISNDALSISDVIQKTFIDVNEGGVEAAAATYAGLTLLSIQSTPEPKQFDVNHPFIYYIKVKGLVVFAGRVLEPWY